MKNKKRFLSLILCFLMLFLVGCNSTLDDNGISVKAFDGAKVLMRPANYFDDMSKIVGERASENYYNIFAENVLNNLYLVYGNREGYSSQILDYQVQDNSSKDFNEAQGTDQYYFYDSLRYTITNVEVTKNDGSDIPTSVKLTLTPNAWKWTLKTEGVGKNFFQKIDENDTNDYISISDSVVTISENFFGRNEGALEWTALYEISETTYRPDLSSFYVGTPVNKSEGVVDYYTSPFEDYPHISSDENQTRKNYFQDALEYATYMFVLGFDYVSEGEDVSTTVVPNLFKFDFTESATEGITGMKVAGWNADGTMNFENEETNVSVEDALGYAKEFYKRTGNIVGVTEEIKGKVARFIKDEVIGDKAFLEEDKEKEGKFTVRFKDIVVAEDEGTTETQTEKTFNRNYDQIIKNIIDYACNQAPIGYDDTNGETVKLGQAYMASQITDFPYNQMLLNDSDNDAHAFDHMPIGEYQSMVFFPKEEDIGQALGTLILAFEYNENPNNQIMLDQLDLTVGLRYYDHEAKAYTVNVQTEKSVKRGKYNEVNNSESPDETWLIIDNSEDPNAPIDLPMPPDLKMKTKFVNEAPLSVIPVLPPEYLDNLGSILPASVLITGENQARKYYKPNNSEYGTFGSLYGQEGDTPDDNYKCWGLEHNCDYLEVYFLVHKNSGDMNTNYNFKVGVRAFAASQK